MGRIGTAIKGIMVISKLQGKYRFLSNFYPAEVEFEGLVYPSAEHAYQAAKTLDFRTRQIFALPDLPPAFAKYLGSVLPCRPSWERIKDDIMYQIVTSKFKNSDLTVRLLATNKERIEEGNDWGDQYWGISRGKGLNKRCNCWRDE